MKITLTIIGFARNKEKEHFGGWKDVVSELVIDKKYSEGLSGLEEYSHLIIIYWMHDVNVCEISHVPQGKVGKVPEVGIFACRCPQRPNPIGITTVKLLSVKENTIFVQGLDVINNTPVLDIKPYTPQYDVATHVKVPSWTHKLDY